MQNVTAGDEVFKWSGGVSQVVMLKTYVLCFLFCWLIFPVFYALWKWIEIRNINYTVTSQRLRVRYGVINRVTDDLELYRIKDLQLNEPFLLRFFSLSNVTIISSDKTHPVLELSAIAGGGQVRDLLRELTQTSRVQHGVREFL